MELFAKVLQGPYAYLLILQVLIVSGLCLTLIYLILMRLRDMPLTSANQATDGTVTVVGHQSSAAAEMNTAMALSTVPNQDAAPLPPVPPPTEVAAFAPTSSPIPDGLMIPAPEAVPMSAPIPEAAAAPVDTEALLKEKERAGVLEQEASAAQEKVRYLESKLLEYEILQEEIGALSALKVENEKLRQELLAAKQAPRTAPAPAVAEVAPTPEPAKKSTAEAAIDLLTNTAIATSEIHGEEGTDIDPSGAVQSQVDVLITQIDTLTRKD